MSLVGPECSSVGRVLCAEQQYKKETHHPDRPLAGGVPVHVGLHQSSAALLQDGVRDAAAPVQVCTGVFEYIWRWFEWNSDLLTLVFLIGGCCWAEGEKCVTWTNSCWSLCWVGFSRWETNPQIEITPLHFWVWVIGAAVSTGNPPHTHSSPQIPPPPPLPQGWCWACFTASWEMSSLRGFLGLSQGLLPHVMSEAPPSLPSPRSGSPLS